MGLTLKELLAGQPFEILQGSPDIEIEDIVCDSRKVVPGCLFCCLVGRTLDGHDYGPAAAKAGAAALLVEQSVEAPEGITVVRVKDGRAAMAHAAAAFYGYPSRELHMIGITGTKGKTTCSYMTKNILEAAGYKVGLIGTIQTLIGDEVVPSRNTTPESHELQQLLRRMKDEGCTYVVMEVSSQGLMMHRVDGTEFELGVFTNISEDHISPTEHKTFAEYMGWKSVLFRMCQHGLVNADDSKWEKVLQGHTCDITTFGMEHPADLMAENVHLRRDGRHLGVDFTLCRDENRWAMTVGLPGKFNVENALVAAGIALYFGIGEGAIRKGLRDVHVRGRVEPVPTPSDYTILIDYAHNYMSMESLLTTLREYNPERLICLFGGGGNRARARRFDMGEISGRYADLTILTEDNPRFEELEDIMEDLKVGLERSHGQFVVIPNRKDAIGYLIDHAQPGDIAVLIGKGHETYQDIKGVKYPFDEREVVKEALRERGWQE